MICKRCGTNNPKGARCCIKCGAELSESSTPMVNVVDNTKKKDTVEIMREHVQQTKVEESKIAIGFISGLFLNLFGYLVMLKFEKYSYERKSFSKGCIIGVICQIIIIAIGVVAGFFGQGLLTI